MKKQSQVVLLLALSVSIFSCGGNDDKPQDSRKTQKAISVEESKQKLEDNMVATFDLIEGYTSSTAVKEITSFLSFLGIDEEIEELAPISFAIESLEATTNYTTDITRVSSVNNLKIAKNSELIQEFKESTGNYVWNAATQEFDFTWADSDKMVLTVLDNGKTSILTIADLEVLVHNSDKEVPTALKVNFKVDNTLYYDHTFSVTLDKDDYIPSAIFNEIVMGDLKFKSQFNKSSENSNAQGNSLIQINGTNILELSFSATGNFKQLNNGEDVLENPIENFLNLATASIAMGKTKVSFVITTKNEIETINNVTEYIAYLNQNVEPTLFFEEQAIATGLFIQEDDDINVKLVFEDGTSATLDTYFGESFENILGRLEDAL